MAGFFRALIYFLEQVVAAGEAAQQLGPLLEEAGRSLAEIRAWFNRLLGREDDQQALEHEGQQVRLML